MTSNENVWRPCSKQVVFQASVYGGIANAVEAFKAAASVVEQYQLERGEA